MPVGLLVEKDTCFIPMHSFILTLVTFKTVFARGHRYVRLIRHTLTLHNGLTFVGYARNIKTKRT